MKPKLLIVDDDDEIRTQMKWALNADYEILSAGDRASAADLLFRCFAPIRLSMERTAFSEPTPTFPSRQARPRSACARFARHAQSLQIDP